MEDYFLKIDGIPGESQDDKHKDWIALASFSWGIAEQGPPSHGGGGAAGRVTSRGFEFVMRANKASPKLFLSCASGQHIKEATLSVRRAGGSKTQLEYLKIKFSDLLVTSFDQAGGEEPPQETVAFDFRQIELAYTPQDSSGAGSTPVTASWDLSKNTKI